MENIFLQLLNMSITAGWLVLAVLVLRLVFRNAPRWIHCTLWALVAVRLICPISIESAFSVVPSAQSVPVNTILSETPFVSDHAPVTDVTPVPPVTPDAPVVTTPDAAPQAASITVAEILTIVWLVGMAALALYALITTLRLHRQVQESVRLHGNVWQSDRITTPFILGVIRPRIFLPTTLTELDTSSVVAHERAHLKRGDHWWKPLGFVLLTVYWFNPLMWLGYILLCRDIETACDEKVIRDMDVAQRKSYSQTILACSAPRHLITACPVAFGETAVKSRVKTVLSYKKPAFWLVLLAVVALAVSSVCLLTNPKSTVSDELDAYLTQVILEHNYSEEHTGDAYPTESHTVFGVEEKDGKTVVYGMVLYEEYYLDETGALQVQNGSYIPTVITVDVEGSGYSLVEYWIPRDGTYYAEDIRNKFPARYQGKAFDIDAYGDIDQKKTLAAAEAHFGLYDEPAADAVVTKANTWQTLGHPMPYSEASKVSDGYPLADNEQEKLQGFLEVLEWHSDAAPTADQLFDAYFSLDGITRYYVCLDTWGDSGYLYDGERYATLPEEQVGSWDFLLADGGSTIKATHVLYGNFAEWNKAERCFVLDVVQADDATLVGKKIRVNTQYNYGRGLPYIGRLLEVHYDGIVLGDTVYAHGWGEAEEDTLDLDTSTLAQSGTITGKVIFVTDKAVLLNCYDKGQFDVVWVRYGDKCPELNPQMYEEYQVGFNGQAMETYPPQITAETMTQVSSTPLNNGFISEGRAIEIAVARWKANLDEPDRETGYYTTVYVMEVPTAENPRYKLGSREVDVQDGEPQNSALYYTMEIDAVTGEVLADSYMP